jgi:hypothetical protein
MRRILTLIIGLWSFAAVAAIEDLSIGVGQVDVGPPVTNAPAGVDANVYSVIFSSVFPTAPAVFILPSNVDPDPMTLRVIRVTTTGFDVFVSESQGSALDYPAISFDYLAVEQGLYDLDGDTVDDIEVGLVNVSNVSSKASGASHLTVNHNLTSTPVVMTELQSINSDTTLLPAMATTFDRITEPFLELSQLPPTATSFQVSLERAETTFGSPTTEQVAWMAVTNNFDFTATDIAGSDVQIKAFNSTDSINGDCTTVGIPLPVTDFVGGDSPIYFGSQVRRDGGDGGWARRCSSDLTSVTVQIEEDLVDTEQTHTTEQVNFVAVSKNFEMDDTDIDSSDITMTVGSHTIPAYYGTVTSYALAPQTVTFDSQFGVDFKEAPIVVPMTTNEGNGLPIFVKVWNVTATGFTIAQTVPEGTVGTPSGTMSVDFMAVIPGEHELPDGTRVEAGIESISGCIGSVSSCGGTYTAIGFGNAFDGVPAVLAAAQTPVNTDPQVDPLLSTSIINVNTSGFSAAFEFAQTSQSSSGFGAQSFGWIAMEGNISANLRAAQGTIGNTDHLVEIRTVVTGNVIGGWDDVSSGTNCLSLSYDTNFSAATAPLLIATHNDRNGGDGGWLRRCTATGSNFSVIMDEDLAVDTERSHGSQEIAGAIAFSDTFAWTPATYSNMKLGATFSDPVNGTSNPKAIPLAEIDYTVFITATSRIGIDDGTVSVTDPIPVNTELFVGDLGGGCPISEEVNTAGVIFTCATDLLLLGGSPVACAADVDGYCPFSTYDFTGIDWSADITSIKVSPTGEFVGSTGVGVVPEFRFRFRVRLN